VVSLVLVNGLVASDLLLVQVLLIARVPLLERAWGQDQLARVHRLVGFTSFDLTPPTRRRPRPSPPRPPSPATTRAAAPRRRWHRSPPAGRARLPARPRPPARRPARPRPRRATPGTSPRPAGARCRSRSPWPTGRSPRWTSCRSPRATPVTWGSTTRPCPSWRTRRSRHRPPDRRGLGRDGHQRRLHELPAVGAGPGRPVTATATSTTMATAPSRTRGTGRGCCTSWR